MSKVISWNSTKNANGTFTARAYSFEYGQAQETHYTYTRNTRAQAVSAAKKAVRYLKSQQRAAA